MVATWVKMKMTFGIKKEEHMKKIITLIAVSLLAFVACQKEFTSNPKDDSSINGNAIPTEIICEISQESTKTQYAGNSTFGWTNSDQIAMPVVKRTSGTITARDLYSFTTTAESGSSSATFIRNTASDDLETYDPNPSNTDGTWTNAGYLIYPVKDYWDSEKSIGKEFSGDYPVVNLPVSIAYNSSTPLNSTAGTTGIVPMIGRKVGETYKFATAVGIVKVTIENIPANLTSVKMVSSDKPIAGKFAVSNSTAKYAGSEVYIAQIANTSEYNSEGSNTLSLTTSGLTEGSNYDFYFPIPVGTYDASTLSIKLCTESGETVKVISKKINKELVVTRNETLSVPELTMTYPRSVSISYGATCCPQINYALDGKTLRFNISKTAEEDLSAYIEGNKFTSGSAWPMAATSSPYTPKVTALSDGGSDKYYFHYIFVTNSSSLTDLGLTSVDDVRILEYGTIPFEYISTSASSITGTYYINNNSSFVVTISATDDAEKGDVIISHFKSSAYDEDMKTYGTYDPYNGEVKFNAAESTDTGTYTYAFVIASDTSSMMTATFVTHNAFAFSGKFGLYEYSGGSWTDKNYSFTSPTLYLQ